MAAADEGSTIDVDVQEEGCESPTTLGDGGAKSKKRVTVNADFVVEYSVDPTVWDAAMLLFFRREGEKRMGTIGDRLILAFAIIANLTIQLLLLLVVYTVMLDNPYNEDSLSAMLRWRGLVGHHADSLDLITGMTKMRSLCGEKNLWSYEQSEFSILDDYFNKPIPGMALSVVGLIIWVLTLLVEYRQVRGQMSCVFNLRTVKPECATAVLLDEGGDPKIKIMGVQNLDRAVMIVLLGLPRMCILLGLCIVGSIFVARTPGLTDIILNCAALAFVLSVDELLFEVLMTNRMKRIVAMTKNIAVQEERMVWGGIALTDFERFILLLGAVAIAGAYALAPFVDSMRAAEQALCSGNVDFVIKMNELPNGKPDPTLVVIQNQTSVEPTCDEDITGIHFHVGGNKSPARKNLSAKRNIPQALRVALGHAFDNVSGVDSLMNSGVLDQLNRIESSVPQCPRFNGTNQSCHAITDVGSNPVQACIWPYESVVCEDTLSFRQAREIADGACLSSGETKNASVVSWDSPKRKLASDGHLQLQFTGARPHEEHKEKELESVRDSAFGGGKFDAKESVSFSEMVATVRFMKSELDSLRAEVESLRMALHERER
eukprot:TRINITY_DN49507_c0_g1_i1.p1 TRINITY_DN49507_c0_g1~~TRINITY_DN49507_c0_g1_i1.p1  ORF type:complete len:617 (-),score=54.05 TRINITY_DN49507_c0_g1_i1:372-2180(-)